MDVRGAGIIQGWIKLSDLNEPWVVLRRPGRFVKEPPFIVDQVVNAAHIQRIWVEYGRRPGSD